MKKIVVVIPTIRNLVFLESWRREFQKLKIIVCEDHDNRQIEVPEGLDIEIYSRAEINKLLGEKSWIIPRFNASIRSFGFFLAHGLGAEYVITLDDDCYPQDYNFVDTHIQALDSKIDERWIKTTEIYTRGFPYLLRKSIPVVVNHGLWDNIIDLDAPTQLVLGSNLPLSKNNISYVPHGNYFPMCGMNLSFTKDAIPMMYFLLMGRDHIFDRFDDIWAGIIVKKICDHLNLGVTTGSPIIRHDRASNVFSNLKKEAYGIEINETFWREIDKIDLHGDSIKDCYVEVAEGIQKFAEKQSLFELKNYFISLSTAMKIWVTLFD